MSIMSITVEAATEQPVYDEARRRGVSFEAKLDEWNIRYTYDPTMSVGDISLLEAVQIRSTEHRVDKRQADEYAEQMRNGAVFPPLVLHADRILLDGNTRLEAAKRLRRKTVPVYHAHFPNMELGRSFAASMNQQNGRRLSPEEAFAAAISLLRFGHTEESVARELAYSRTHISNWRRESEFMERAEAALVAGKAGELSKPQQRKLADIKQSAPFAAAVDLVAVTAPSAKDVTELVQAVTSAPSEADAVAAVEERRRSWAPSGPKPHRPSATSELAAVRRCLPQLVAITNPLLVVETDDERREAAVRGWEALHRLAGDVLAAYRG